MSTLPIFAANSFRIHRNLFLCRNMDRSENKKSRTSIYISLLLALVVLVVSSAFLDYFLKDSRVSSSAWSMLDLQSLQAIRDHIFTVAQIIAVVLLLILGVILIIFVRYLFQYLNVGKGITVLPFEIAAGEDKLNGRALRDLFTAEWQDLSGANNQDISDELELSAGLPTSDVGANVARTLSPPDQFTNLVPSREAMASAVANVAVVGIGQTTVSIGQLIVALRTVWSSRDNGSTNLAGSLLRSGQLLTLAMSTETRSGPHVWKVSREVKNGDEVPRLVKDLTFRVYKAMDEMSAKPHISA